jgi:Methylamine utilisation protein MauE
VNDASLALAARIVLAVVLAVSAAAKLRSRAAVQEHMDDMVGARLAPLVGPALPVAELVVAVALVAWWSPVPGVVALVLLAAFTVVLVRAQARHVPCMCFGATQRDATVGAAAVVRNGVLAALAVLAIGDPSGARVGATIGLCVVFGLVAGVAVRASS